MNLLTEDQRLLSPVIALEFIKLFDTYKSSLPRKKRRNADTMILSLNKNRKLTRYENEVLDGFIDYILKENAI